MIDSVFKTGENYYPQVFLEECKCIFKEKKMPKCTDNLEFSSDEETSDEENCSEKNYMKNIVLKNKLNIVMSFLKKFFWECLFWGSNF